MRDEQRVEPTKERVAKGRIRNHYDPDGRFLRTEVLPDTIIGWLVHRELVDTYYADVASHFADWRRSFLSQTAYKPPKFYQSEAGGYQGDDLTASRYVKACRILGPTAQFLLDAIEPGWDVCPAVSPNDYLWALKRLDKAMAEACDEVGRDGVNIRPAYTFPLREPFNADTSQPKPG